MDSRNAVESLLEVLLTSNKWQEREKSVELLLEYDDNTHFSKIKNAYTNEIRSKIKLNLIDLLTKFYAKQAIPFLIGQYKNENDWKVRKYMIEKIGTTDHPEVLKFLIDTIADKDVETKKTSIILLSRLKTVPRSALSPLFEQLKHRNAEVFDLLINNIVKIGKNGYLEDILEFKNKGNINVMKAIPIILGKIGDKEAKRHLIEFLKDKNYLIRLNTIEALPRLKLEQEDTMLIIKMLDDENEEVQLASVRALGTIGDKIAIKPLFELLKQERDQFNKFVVNSLAKILKKSTSIKKIYEYAKKGNSNVRKETAVLLGLLKNVDAIDTLISLLNSRNVRIRRAATSSIIRISRSNKTVIEKIILALKSKEWQIRKYSARILGIIKEETAVNQLFSLLKDPKGGVRRVVSNSLARLPEKLVVKIATKSLESGDWKYRRAIVQLLVKIGTENSLKPLISCLEDDDPYVKAWAARGIGRLKSLKDFEPLLLMLKNDNPKLRISAINALGAMGGDDKISYLVEMLGDDNWEVKTEAEKALNKINPNWMSLL